MPPELVALVEKIEKYDVRLEREALVAAESVPVADREIGFGESFRPAEIGVGADKFGFK